MATDKAEVLKRLWEKARTDGVFGVQYIARPSDPRNGFFFPNDDGIWGIGPGIRLRRHPPPPPAVRHEPDLAGPYVLHDLITLAHEYGHFRSWKDAGNGTAARWVAYSQATAKRDTGEPLLRADKEIIIEEERRAWDLGRDALQSLGFSEWTDFDQRRVHGLGAHHERMSMVDSQDDEESEA